MIKLSNEHSFTYMVASGALAFDGKGWPWEKPLVWFGLIDPRLFTVVCKTVTLEPRNGNLRWWKPTQCVKTIPGGVVNKVGLTNPGFDWWCRKIGEKANRKKQPLVASVWGKPKEVGIMLQAMNNFDLVAVEVNDSCPNTGDDLDNTQASIDLGLLACATSTHPVIHKVSVTQDYVSIIRGLSKAIEAVSINSVPWELAFPSFPTKKSPLTSLGGGGGVSGRPAQEKNWEAVSSLSFNVPEVPVIGPSIMEYEDLGKLKGLGASAYSFGAIHLPDHPWWRSPLSIFANPCKPTRIVERHRLEIIRNRAALLAR